MSCAGCEDLIPTIEWYREPIPGRPSRTPAPMTPQTGGGYSDPAHVPITRQGPNTNARVSPLYTLESDGFPGYVKVELERFDVVSSAGLCVAASDSGACVQQTSCGFDLACTWRVDFVNTADTGREIFETPIAPTIQVGSGPAQAAGSVSPVVYVFRDNLFGQLERVSTIRCQYAYSYSPQCGATTIADFFYAQITVAIPGFTVEPPPLTPVSDLRLRFSCAKCQPSKATRPGGDNQDTGKNANPNSIANPNSAGS